ncbi:MAG TPA: hypothetical protein VFA20_08495 [Myxococcaceae bacterium]|nr:hypothetical protein [Myxococcaceae bacterium]
MAASIQSQPPKPPPAPPKVDAAPKADAKPAVEAKPGAQASAAPKPAQTPDVFEQASGGGRGVPTNGGSSFTAAPAVTAAQAQIQDALGSGKAAVQGAVNDLKSNVSSAVNGFKSDLQNVFGSMNGAVQQGGPASDFQMAPDPAGFNDFSNELGNMWGGGPGATGGDLSMFRSLGGAAGGVGDRSPVLNLQDTFSRNFGGWDTGGGFGGGLLDGAGGGGKPGIGGGLSYLNSYGGGAGLTTPVQTAPSPSISTPSSNSSSRSPFNFGFDFGGHGNGFHLGFFNFGSARGGGGGAAGGVADRSGPRYEG